MQKADGIRILTCIAVYLGHGVDLRLLDGGDIRRTQLVRDGPQAEAMAEDWHGKALSLGWAERQLRKVPTTPYFRLTFSAFLSWRRATRLRP